MILVREIMIVEGMIEDGIFIKKSCDIRNNMLQYLCCLSMDKTQIYEQDI